MNADTGRAAVYAAEESAFGGTELEDIRSFTELEEAAADLTGGEWWRGAGGPPVHITTARLGTGSSSARQTSRGARDPVEIRLAAGQDELATLTHELAHALAGVAHGHDARFRAAHVDVCAVVAGRAAATALQSCYVAFGVAPARRPWPPPLWATGNGFAIVR